MKKRMISLLPALALFLSLLPWLPKSAPSMGKNPSDGAPSAVREESMTQ